MLKKFFSVLIAVTLFSTIFSSETNKIDNRLLIESISDSVNQAFKSSLSQFIVDKGFSEAIVSIYKDGNKIIDECYGKCEDQSKIYPIASVSKLFTEAAVNRLISEGKLAKETRVIDFLDLKDELLDERVKEITVQQLLDHTGGWDRDLSDDPLFSFDTLPKEINSKKQLIKYVLTTTRLDHEPGEVESYSNFGYLLLGKVIEKASGEKYLDYINKNLAEPNQIHLYQACFGQNNAPNSLTNYFNLELSTASFGLAANISDLCYYFTKVSREGVKKDSVNQTNETWWKDGSLPGSVTSLVKQLPNNIVIALYIPGRNEESWMDDNELLNEIVDETAESLGLA